jgi:hypothetical protein
MDTGVVAVERDPLSGALRLRGVAPGRTELLVDFRDTGASERVKVHVVASRKVKKRVQRASKSEEKPRIFEIPGW